ncbi:MAG TPA: heterodisulfide reductase, subunit B [Candidatus Korarchaeota archaeon]|nr:heterodisulfide reductase, subunit B [Candidatus Korarchaeota archaeon]
MVIGMKVLFYPGCSLKNNYPEFEKSSLEVCRKLGIELLEIPRWTCCGVNFSLATDNVMRHLGAVRSLINAREKGKEMDTKTVVTACSMCYNVLKRVNLTLREDPDKLETINSFIDDQPDYVPELEITHLLSLFEKIGFDKIGEIVVKPLKGLKVASYYGCALLRPNKPRGIPIDDPESPTILEELMESIGAEPIDFPFKTECCGNYHVVFRPDIVEMRAEKIISSARSRGADIIVSACPLCLYNLERGNEILDEGRRAPIVFFTQLMALSFGVNSYLNEEIKEWILKKC